MRKMHFLPAKTITRSLLCTIGKSLRRPVLAARRRHAPPRSVSPATFSRFSGTLTYGICAPLVQPKAKIDGNYFHLRLFFSFSPFSGSMKT